MRSLLAIAAASAAMMCGLAAADEIKSAPSVPPTPEAMAVVPADSPTPATPALTRTDVEAWLDGYMTYALPRGDVAGAVVVVVKDGEVLLQKGYGYADVAQRKPVDPERTLFRPGSVSKLFTWTAVMQMVEQGKVDLDTDVNTYLDFKIPERDGKPVTLRNVMTHTAGFEEQVKGLMGVEGAEMAPLGEHLKRWVPERIFPPGETPAYSNYATALAGCVVARVSGMSFDDYIEANIFAPLGMQFASFRQPLPDHLREHMSKGYQLASEPEKPFEIVGPAPAGSLSASGADMARFMIAHLQKGRYGDNRILSEQTARQMHETAHTILPRVHRMMLGFYETNYNGRRVIAHGGDTMWFHSYLHLFVDDNVGLFMSFNSAGKDGATGGLRTTLFEQFADRYFPGPAADGEVDGASAAEHARMMAGIYDNSRRMESSFLSLLNLFGGIKVIANEDNTISVPLATTLSGAPQKWREIEPFLWRATDGEQLLSAKVENGRVTRFSMDGISPFMMFEPVSALKSPAWLMPALMAGAIAMLLTSLAWPVSALVRRHYGVSYALAGQDAASHGRVRIASVAVVAVWIAWAVTISSMMSDFNRLTPALDPWLWILQLVTLVVFLGATAIGLWNASVVMRGARRWYAKLWAVLLAVGFLITLWVGLAFHLIAFDVNY